MEHIPVLLNTVVDVLNPQSGETVVDATLGLGGHANAMLERLGKSGHLIGFDADEENLAEARGRLQPYADRMTLHHSNFRSLQETLSNPVDVILADLGLSSPHLDDAERGFSFRYNGPLDLRFDRSKGITAAQWIQEHTDTELAHVLRDFGELKSSMRIARELKTWTIDTTNDVVDCCKNFLGSRAPNVLPQIFQALRIVVNDELNALMQLLQDAPHCLAPCGRLGIISYHSLEDRLVKQTFRMLSTAEKDDVTGQDIAPAPFELLHRKPLVPSEEEIQANPRSRSAKFRVLRKRSSLS